MTEAIKPLPRNPDIEDLMEMRRNLHRQVAEAFAYPRLTMMADVKSLDDKGRCCGTKPLVYKGGSWRSPLGAPMQVCLRCGAVYELDGTFREKKYG
ncbi:MAG: hypothetical protein OXC11_02375 [Rhodospirillales bacterium]|nr:hypothetical protein [Rhodospirillales bacterium]